MNFDCWQVFSLIFFSFFCFKKTEALRRNGDYMIENAVHIQVGMEITPIRLR